MVPAKVIRKMRRLFSVYMALIAVITTQASAVNFTISNGIDNAAVKSRIENSVSRILNEINAAQSSGRSLNFAAMGVGTSVQQSMACFGRTRRLSVLMRRLSNTASLQAQAIRCATFL